MTDKILVKVNPVFSEMSNFAVTTESPAIFKAVECLALSLGYTWYTQENNRNPKNLYIGFKIIDNKPVIDSSGYGSRELYNDVFNASTEFDTVIERMHQLISKVVSFATLDVCVRFKCDLKDNVVKNIHGQEITISTKRENDLSTEK